MDLQVRGAVGSSRSGTNGHLLSRGSSEFPSHQTVASAAYRRSHNLEKYTRDIDLRSHVALVASDHLHGMGLDHTSFSLRHNQHRPSYCLDFLCMMLHSQKLDYLLHLVHSLTAVFLLLLLLPPQFVISQTRPKASFLSYTLHKPMF